MQEVHPSCSDARGRVQLFLWQLRALTSQARSTPSQAPAPPALGPTSLAEQKGRSAAPSGLAVLEPGSASRRSRVRDAADPEGADAQPAM